MYISEIAAGMPVKLQVVIGTKMLEFETQAVQVEDKRQVRFLDGISNKIPYVVVDAIKKNDKVIGFPDKGASYRVFYMDAQTNKPYTWQDVSVKQVGFPTGEKYHIFISDKNMKEINRRESYRLWLGCDAYVQTGLNSKYFPAVIRDISATGIAFILYRKHLEKVKYKPEPGTIAKIQFTDESTEIEFKLTATILRSQEMEGERMLYACKFPQENIRVAQFVNEKQRERNRMGVRRRDEEA